MLYEGLAKRAERCSALNAMLADDPEHKDAGDWIAEIAEKGLTRKEDRHLAVVRQVHKLRRNIARTEGLKDNIPALKDRLKRLQARVDGMRSDDKGYDRFSKKLVALAGRIEDDAISRKKGRIPGLKRRLENLMSSTDLLTKEDVLDG